MVYNYRVNVKEKLIYKMKLQGGNKMGKKDFSIRIEVEAMLENMNMKMTEEQIDEVIDEIQQYDTFLSITALFVAKSIRDVFENKGLDYDNEEIGYQIQQCSRAINPEHLI